MKTIFIKQAGRRIAIQLDKVSYVEAKGDFVGIHTTENKSYTITHTMKKMMKILPNKEFIRIHNSFIAQLDMITAIDEDCVTVDSHIVIPISRGQKKELMERITVL